MKIVVIIILILLVIAVLAVTYLLVCPIKMIVDSPNQIFLMYWGQFIHASLVDENKSWGIRLKLPFWSKHYTFQRMVENRNKNNSKPDKKPSARQKKFNFSKVRRILRQIKIKRLILSIDTSDVIYNAYLFPIFEFLRYRTGYRMQINYLGINRITLNAESRMINLIMAVFIK